MKQITAIAAILLASLAAAGSASAQNHVTIADVPFGFYVDSQWVPAGTYILAADTKNPEIITIRNQNGSVALMNVGGSVDRQPGKNVVVFRKYGDKYFLGEILSTNAAMHVGFAPSKRERAARSGEASTAAPTQVYLALK